MINSLTLILLFLQYVISEGDDVLHLFKIVQLHIQGRIAQIRSHILVPSLSK